METKVYTKEGQESGRSLTLSEEIFGVEPNEHAMHMDVKHYLASQRQGTHQARERSQLSGSTKKLKRQKGTGTARSGDIKSPIFRGGARAFGPRSRSHSFKLNKKAKQHARRSALSTRAKNDALRVVEDFTFEQPRTKEMVAVLKSLEAGEHKVLLVTGQHDANVFLSGRNLPKTEVLPADQINTYQILNAQYLLLMESAVAQIEETLKKA